MCLLRDAARRFAGFGLIEPAFDFEHGMSDYATLIPINVGKCLNLKNILGLHDIDRCLFRDKCHRSNRICFRTRKFCWQWTLARACSH